MIREFMTNKGRKAMVKNSKYTAYGAYSKILVEIDGEWKTVVSRCCLSDKIINKVKQEY